MSDFLTLCLWFVEIRPYLTDKWIPGNCTLSDPEKECGEGNRAETRECFDGNIDDCTIFQDSEKQKTSSCNIPCPTKGNISSR